MQKIFTYIFILFITTSASCNGHSNDTGESQKPPGLTQVSTSTAQGISTSIQSLATQPAQPYLPSGVECSYSSQGSNFSGWYWLRDTEYSDTAEWRCKGFLANEQLPITLVTLVTNQANGGSGYSVPVNLVLPQANNLQGINFQVYLQNPFQQQDPNNSQGVGYLTSGYTILPIGAVNSNGELVLNIKRIPGYDHHVATNIDTLRNASTVNSLSFRFNGLLTSGWNWMNDDNYQDSAKWEFHHLDKNASISILELKLQMKREAKGNPPLITPVKLILTNSTSGLSQEFNNLMILNPITENSIAGIANGDTPGFGSLIFPTDLIDSSGRLGIEINRLPNQSISLAVAQDSVQIVQFKEMQINPATQTITATPEMNQALCESMGGRWGQIGLSPKEECNLPTKDADKLCSDSSQCESMCIAELSEEEMNRVFREGAVIKTDGKCAAWKIVVGCIPIVKNGIVQIICID